MQEHASRSTPRSAIAGFGSSHGASRRICGTAGSASPTSGASASPFSGPAIFRRIAFASAALRDAPAAAIGQDLLRERGVLREVVGDHVARRRVRDRRRQMLRRLLADEARHRERMRRRADRCRERRRRISRRSESAPAPRLATSSTYSRCSPLLRRARSLRTDSSSRASVSCAFENAGACSKTSASACLRRSSSKKNAYARSSWSWTSPSSHGRCAACARVGACLRVRLDEEDAEQADFGRELRFAREDARATRPFAEEHRAREQRNERRKAEVRRGPFRDAIRRHDSRRGRRCRADHRRAAAPSSTLGRARSRR